MSRRTLFTEPLFRYIAGASLVIVAMASFVPNDVVAPGRWNLGHLPAYALLTGAVIMSLPRSDRTLLAVLGATFAIAVFGLVIEFLQPLVGRTTSAADFASNIAGIATGVMAYALYAWLVRKTETGNRH